MTGELIGISAACGLALGLGAAALLVVRVLWWGWTERRRDVGSHAE